jgi:predicted PurR-regulated permease PerM
MPTMDPTPPPPCPAPAPPAGGGAGALWPRAHTRALVVFLAVFLLLIVVFRHVLFPFLMAIYLAYLVEPVIGWATRGKTLGLRWKRAPVLIVMYVIVIGAMFMMVSCGVEKLSVSARRAASDLKVELDKSAPAAKVRLSKPVGKDVWVPAGTTLADAQGRRWKTLFPAQVSEGLTEVRVLLEPPPDSAGAQVATGSRMTVEDPAALRLPEDVTVDAAGDKRAEGLELGTERFVIDPVSRRLGAITGEPFNPDLLRTFIKEKSDEHGSRAGEKVLAWATRLPVTLGGSIYQVVLVLMLTAFIVIDRRNIASFFATLPPPHLRPGYAKLMAYVDRGLAGVIRGQLLICVVNGFLTWLGLWIYGIPYATLLAFIAGVFSLIPVFGTIASSIPIVIVALATGGWDSALFALAWITLIHLLEANVFNPLIMGSAAEMHPVIIVFSLLAGEHAFGVWGALLAVPTASLIQSGFKYYRHEILGIPHAEHHGHGRWMRKFLSTWKSRRATGAPGATP